jgi:hypothetical protein
MIIPPAPVGSPVVPGFEVPPAPLEVLFSLLPSRSPPLMEEQAAISKIGRTRKGVT